MPRKKAARRKAEPEIIYFIGQIERSALSYGINHYHHKHDPLRPYSRSLHLYGRMLYPERLRAHDLEVWLMGKSELVEEPGELGRALATLEKRGDKIDVTVLTPIEYIRTLSEAFHDDRLHIVAARGPALSRNGSVLIDIAFENRAYFEDYWGEALPLLDQP